MGEAQHFVWDASPILFDLGFYQLRWYSLLFALTFIAGYYIMQRFFKLDGKPLDELDTLAIYMMIATVVGARLGHMFFYAFDKVQADPLSIFYVWEGGLASHGAAIGLLLSMWLFAKKKGFRFLWIADRIVVTVALSGLFIRTGNFFNSEIVGKPTDSSLGVVFARLGEDFARHPAQLYEAFYYSLVFILLMWLVNKQSTKNMGKQTEKDNDGLALGLFLVLVFAFRFIVEFFKANQVMFEDGMALNMGQWLSIPFVLIGLGLLVWRKKAITKT
ncbi:MAG: prolipoprotein diacylglyceryl transferase [Candidatus Kapaibacteriales bacterium]